MQEMNLRRRIRRRLASLAFGPQELCQFCNLGLKDPQCDIKVWLVGTKGARDVTARNVLAATRPLSIGIGLENDEDFRELSSNQVFLEFRSAHPPETLLGKVNLTFTGSIPLEGDGALCLFNARHPSNYCQARTLVWKRYLNFSYAQWKNERGPSPPKVRMVGSELHSLFVFYICPRPVVLVSVADGQAGNIFPMDLVGPIGHQQFSLALHATSKGLPLIERSGRIALSSVPVAKMSLAYQMGQNHNKASICWSSVPFPLIASPRLCLPIPEFALRVRELQLVDVRPTGSHVLIICRVVTDHAFVDGLQFFQAHGFYDEWRKQAILH